MSVEAGVSAATTATVPRSGGGRRRILRPLGWLVAAACLAWVLHDVDGSAVLASAGSIHWGWVAVAMALDLLGYAAQGGRWWLLLPRPHRPTVLRTTQAIYAGLFVNELLPGRPGELLRAWLVRRWSGAAMAPVLASIALERWIDGVWLAAAVGLIALLVPLPRYLLDADEILLLLVLVGAALLVPALWRGRRAVEPAAGVSAWSRLAAALAAGGRRAIAVAFVVSPLVPLLESLALWAMMRGYGLHVPVACGIAVMLIIRLGTAIPTVPGNVGAYQFLCVLGLTRFGIDKATATGFSLVAFVLLTLPLLVLGFAAFAASGLTLAGLHRDLESALDR